jgi:hypothetical protein
VDVPNDGDHVVRYRTSGLGTGPGPQLRFYRRGELLQEYQADDLMSVPWIVPSGSWLSEHHLSDDSRMVTVETETGDRYVFDAQTGELISRFRPVRYALVGTVAAVILSIWWVWRRRRLRASRPGAVTPPSHLT